MKKSLMYATIGLVALASCSENGEEVVVKNQDGAINFRAILDRMTTKGAAITQANIEDFSVDCYMMGSEYFKDAKVSKQSDGTWQTAGTYYWPNSDDEKLYFYGWAPSIASTAATENRSMDDNGVTWADFSAEHEMKKQYDLMYAMSVATKGEKGPDGTKGEGVHMDFIHTLSQVNMMVVNNNKQMDVKLRAVKINGIANKGTFKGNTDTTVCAGGYSQGGAGSWNGVAERGLRDVNTDVFWALYDSDIQLGADSINLINGNVWEKDEENEAMFLLPQQTGMASINKKGDVGKDALDGQKLYWDQMNKDSVSVSFLCQIRFMGEQAWPDSCMNNSDSNEAGWEAGDWGYAWASVNIPAKFERGKKYVYVFDFGSGAGYSDPDANTIGDLDLTGINVNEKPELDVKDTGGVINNASKRIAGTGYPILREWDPIKFCCIHVYDWQSGEEEKVEFPYINGASSDNISR